MYVYIVSWSQTQPTTKGQAMLMFVQVLRDADDMIVQI